MDKALCVGATTARIPWTGSVASRSGKRTARVSWSSGDSEVSRAVGALVRGGLVQIEQDNLYPVRNPQASMFKKSEGGEAGRWRRFFAEFTCSDPETALQYRALEKQFNQVKKFVMRRYRAWGKVPEVADSTNCSPDTELEKFATGVADSTNYGAESVVDSNHAPLQESKTDQKTKATDLTALTENAGAPSLTLNSECLPSSSSVHSGTSDDDDAPSRRRSGQQKT